MSAHEFCAGEHFHLASDDDDDDMCTIWWENAIVHCMNAFLILQNEERPKWFSSMQW